MALHPYRSEIHSLDRIATALERIGDEMARQTAIIEADAAGRDAIERTRKEYTLMLESAARKPGGRK